MNIGSMYVTLGVNLSQLDKMVPALNRTAQRLRTFGYLASTAITLPILAAGKASFKMASDFEFSMQKIVGLAGVAQSSVNEFSKAVLDMGPKVGKGPMELAEALYFINSSGIKGAEALNVLETSAMAATAGLGETKQVADLLTSALNAYAGTGLTAAKAADILVAAVREGKGEADAFARTIGSVIPIAAELGVSFDQVAGSMAAMTLEGASAANAATYLKGFFNVLLKAPPKGEALLNSLGSSYAHLRDVLRGPNGTIKVLEELRRITKGNEEAMSDIFPNIRALTMVLSVSGKNFDYNSKLMQRVTRSAGSLNDAFAAVSLTAKVKLDQAMAGVQKSMISFGQNLIKTVIPIIENLAKRLEKWSNSFNALSEAQKHNRIITAVWIAAAGPIALLLSAIIYTITGLITVVSALGKALLWLGDILKATAVWAVANPYLALATAILVVVAAVSMWIIKMAQARKEQERLQKIQEEKPLVDFMTKQGRLQTNQSILGQNQQVMFAMTPEQLAEQKDALERQVKGFQDLNVEILASKVAYIQGQSEYQELVKRAQIAQAEYNKVKNYIKGNTVNGIDVKGVAEDELNAANAALRKYLAIQDKSWATLQSINDKGIKESERQYKEVQTMLDPILAEIARKKAAEEKLVQETAAISEIFGGVKNDMAKLDRESKIFGDSFDYNAEKLKVFQSALEALAGTSIPLTDKRLQDLLKTFERLSHIEFFKKMDEKIKKEKQDYIPVDMPFENFGKLITASRGSDTDFLVKFGEELDLIALKEETLGNKFNKTRTEVDYFKDTINKLWDAGQRPGKDPMLDMLTKRMNALTLQAEAQDILAAGFTRLFSATREDMNNFSDFFKSWTKELLHAFQQMIAKMIAEKLAMSIIGILTGGASIPFNPKVPSPLDFAGGGVVPPGYPNDSYPAMLTSGETIIPAGGFKESFNQPASMMDGTVVFEIGQDKLIGILRKGNKKNSLY